VKMVPIMTIQSVANSVATPLMPARM
jgi:hypothetical protein